MMEFKSSVGYRLQMAACGLLMLAVAAFVATSSPWIGGLGCLASVYLVAEAIREFRYPYLRLERGRLGYKFSLIHRERCVELAAVTDWSVWQQNLELFSEGCGASRIPLGVLSKQDRQELLSRIRALMPVPENTETPLQLAGTFRRLLLDPSTLILVLLQLLVLFLLFDRCAA